MSLARTAALLLIIACDRSSSAPPPPRTEAAAFERARTEHKGVMIEFCATWATPCLELDTSLRDPGVSGPLMASFVPLALDVTENTDADAEVMDRYAVRGVPALVFLAADGRVVGRVTTALDPPQLAESITAAAAQLRH